MKILKFAIKETSISSWKSNVIEFGNVNLIVGNSGSGKSNLLRSLFNMGTAAVRSKDKAVGGWSVEISQDDKIYKWDIKFALKDNLQVVEEEHVVELRNGDEIILVDRSADKFIFLDDKLPKLSNNDSAIYLLKDEDTIKPIYAGMASITRRDFSSGKLKESMEQHVINLTAKDKIGKDKNFNELINLNSMNDRLDIIEKYMPDIYKNICNSFIDVFSFIKDVQLKKIQTNIGLLPIFHIKERNSQEWVPLAALSSGMQKVLYILTDVYSLPKGTIYLLDEYENSLGINAIDFFPNFLTEHFNDNQFFITSHHPYIINNIPTKDWYICHRVGTNINVKYGAEIEKRYGGSKQKSFINLINDPFFLEGVE